MKNDLATTESHQPTRTLVQFTGRWIEANWPLHLGRNRRVRQGRRKRCRTARRAPDDGAHRDYFTIEEHLWVQQQIEQRAYQLWREGGGCHDVPLANWIKAEAEVVREFCLSRQLSHAISL